MYFLVLKLGEIKSILGIGPALIEIIGVFSQNFSNFIWWGVTRGMRVRLEEGELWLVKNLPDSPG